MFSFLNNHLDLQGLNTRSFMGVFSTHALYQHVSFPAHVHGHWLTCLLRDNNIVLSHYILFTPNLHYDYLFHFQWATLVNTFQHVNKVGSYEYSN